MKKTLFVLASLAVAAGALLSCAKEVDLEPKEKEQVKEEPQEIVINVIANNQVSSDTKTMVVDGNPPVVQWVDTDAIKIYEVVDGSLENTTASLSTTITDGVATFQARLSGEAPTGDAFSYSAVYPAASATVGGSGKFQRILMPSEQHLVGNNFSADSDILISAPLDHGTSRATNEENMLFSFRRIGTVVRLNLIGIPAGELIDKVVLMAPVNVAGYMKYDPVTSSIYEPYYSNASSMLTLAIDNVECTGNDVFWCRVMSENWAKDSELGVIVETDKALYYRDGRDADHQVITLPIEFEFPEGGVTKLPINLGPYRVEKDPAPAGVTFVKELDASVTVEDYLAIDPNTEFLVAATSSDKTYAMSAYNSTYYSKVDVTETNNVISITDEAIITITLEHAGYYAPEDPTTQRLYYVKDSEGNYLSWSSGNSVSRGEKQETNAFKWMVSLSSIANYGTPARALKYNASSPRFACYTTDQTPIALYVKTELGPELEEAGLAFEGVDAPIAVSWDARESFVKPTLTNPHDLTVTYSSSNPSAATVDETTGDITFVGNGQTVITASSEATEQYKAGNASYIIVVSGKPAEKGSEGNPYTVAEALAVIDALEDNASTVSEVYVEGIVSNVKSYYATTKALNYCISDDGETTSGQLDVYRGKGLNGADFTSVEDLWNGCLVVVSGKLKKYVKDTAVTPEFDAGSIITALVEADRFVASLSNNTISYEGGRTIQLTIKANVPWTATIDNGASLGANASANGNSNYNCTVTIPQNDAGAIYTISFTTTSIGIQAPANLTITQSAKPTANDGDGSKEHPFTMAGVKSYIDSGGNAKVYVAGKVSAIVSQYSSTYGNATFWISDDGSSNEFEAYRVNYLGNNAWAEGDHEVAVGDDVILYGNVTKYNTTYETQQNNAYLYSLNGLVFPIITAENISGVDAAGVTTTTSVTFVDDEGWTASVTPDGTVVTAASIAGTTITYTVAANDGGARNGSITVTLTKDTDVVSKVITVSQNGGSATDWSTVNTSNVTLTPGTNGTDAKVNDYSAVKLGTSKNGGDMTVVVPAGTTKLHLHAAAWKGVTGLSLNITGATATPASIALTADDGISNSSPFTLSGNPEDYYFEIALSGIEAATTIKLTTSTTKRCVIWGVNAE